MKQVKLSDKIFNIPECWEEVTVEQLIKINAGIQRPIELLSIFTLPVYELSKLKNLVAVEEIELSLQFLSTTFDFEKAINNKPDKFVFNQYGYSLSTDLGDSSIGQYKDLAHIYSEYIKEGDQDTNLLRRFKCYVDAISIYLQPLVHNSEYDYQKAEGIAEQIYQCSAVEVAGYGHFFIMKFLELRTGILTDVRKVHTPQRKVRQGIRYYLKRLIGVLPFTHYPVGTLKNKTT
jgi:hypothetical protein